MVAFPHKAKHVPFTSPRRVAGQRVRNRYAEEQRACRSLSIVGQVTILDLRGPDEAVSVGSDVFWSTLIP